MALVLYQGPSENPFGSASGIAESKEGSSFVGLVSLTVHMAVLNARFNTHTFSLYLYSQTKEQPGKWFRWWACPVQSSPDIVPSLPLLSTAISMDCFKRSS